MNAPAIEVTGLRKTFGGTVALDGVDLLVPTGSVFALLGPNGAGKTTIVHILSTLLQADEGTVRVAGHDPATDPGDVRRAIGVTGQFSAVDGLLNARENLTLMADLCHLGREEGGRRVAAMLERFDLADEATKPVSTYSGGMRRRLDLAMTLMGDPRIIFLDDRRPASTLAAAGPCGTSSAVSSTRASRSCSPRTIWKKPIAWPIAWRCSITVA